MVVDAVDDRLEVGFWMVEVVVVPLPLDWFLLRVVVVVPVERDREEVEVVLPVLLPLLEEF